MTLLTRTLRIKLLSHLGQPLAGAMVTAQLSAYQIDETDVVPLMWQFFELAATPGTYSGQIWPNTRGDGGTTYEVTVQAAGLLLKRATITVAESPDALQSEATLMVDPPPYPAVYQAQAEVAAARTFSESAGTSASIALAKAGEAVSLLARSLRTPETSVADIPAAAQRRGKLLAFEDSDEAYPSVYVPQAGSALDLAATLAQPTGAGNIGFRGRPVDPATTVQERLRTISFDSPRSIIETAQVGLGVGYRWGAEDFSYTEVSSGHNVVTKSGVKLQVRVDGSGSFNVRALGSYGDGMSHPLGQRYATLAAAQTAFPLCSAAGLITSLDDEIDWACIQESILAAQNLSNRPFVRIGPGVHCVNRALVSGGLGRGVTIVGTDYRSAQQGSTRTGTTLRYTGTPATGEPVLSIGGTFTKLVNLAFENTGNARCAVRFTGATPTSGAGRSHMEHISVQEGQVGVDGGGNPVYSTPFSRAAFEVYNGIDYTYWRDIEVASSSPHVLFFDGGGLTSGGTTRFEIANSVFSLIGEVYKQAIYLTNANVENFKIRDTSFNNYAKTQPCTIFDCDNIDPDGAGFDINVLTFESVEFDGLTTSPTSRLARLTNVRMANFTRCFYQNVTAVQTALVDLTNSTAKADINEFYAVDGPVFNCRDSLSKVIPGRNVFNSVRGLANSSLTANIIRLVQAAAVSLTGADVDNQHQGYDLEITNNASLTVSARSHADSPPGRWLQGQLVTLRIYNTGAAALAGLNWGAGIRAASFGSLGPGMGRTITFRWDGSVLRECGRSIDVPN